MGEKISPAHCMNKMQNEEKGVWGGDVASRTKAGVKTKQKRRL